MSADVIRLLPTFNPVRVELTSPGTQNGVPFYFVDFVEADGCRSIMWSGTDRNEAQAAATECSNHGRCPVHDLVAEVVL